MIHLPCFTGEVRPGLEGEREHAAVREHAAASRRQGDAEVVAGHAFQAVMLGQPFIDEGEVAGEKIEHRAIFLDDRREKHFGLAGQVLLEGRVKLLELGGVGRGAVEQ